MRILKDNAKRATAYIKELTELSLIHHISKSPNQISFLFSDGEVIQVQYLPLVKQMLITKHIKVSGEHHVEAISCLDELEIYILCRKGF